MTTTVGLLHPGEMGAAGRAGGARVLCVSEGRGAETRARAAAAGLEGAGDVYRRMAGYKDAPTPPTIDEVAKALRKEPGR